MMDERDLGTVFTPSLSSNARIITVAHRAKALRKPVELMEESSLAVRLVAAVNVSVTDIDGDGLMGQMDETLYTVSEE